MKSQIPTLSDTELAKVTAGKESLASMLSKIVQAKNDMQKGIIANFRV